MLVNSCPDVDNSVENLATKGELPTKTSDLINDSGFIKIEDVPSPDLSNYYTKGEIDDLVGNINTELEDLLGV
jgi:hypothetical protein